VYGTGTARENVQDAKYNDISIEELYTRGAGVLDSVNQLAERYEREAEILNREADILEAANAGKDTQVSEATLQDYKDALSNFALSRAPLINKYNTIYTADGKINGLSVGICTDNSYHAKPTNVKNLKKPWYIPIYGIQEGVVDAPLGSILVAADSPKLQTCSCISQYTAQSGASCTVCTGRDGLAQLSYVGGGVASDCTSTVSQKGIDGELSEDDVRKQQKVDGTHIVAEDIKQQDDSLSVLSSFIKAGSSGPYILDSEFDTALDTHDSRQRVAQRTVFGSFMSFIHATYTNTVDLFFR